MIEVKKANKFFNKNKKNQIHVINNTSIKFEEAGLVAILGESGCGKTTFLNTIGGLDKLNSGSIYLNGKRITPTSSNKADEIRNAEVGYIFQNYYLIDDMSVFDNVAISLKMIGLKDKKEIEERVNYILEKLGIFKYRRRPVSMLSGGERQRVGIARAIVKNPKIIIADEPTGNLDSKNTIEIMNIIKSISKDKLVILVTHEKDIAKFYASRIINLVDGKVVGDNLNNHDDDLDYYIDNNIYLKDFEFRNKNLIDNVNFEYYGDELKDIEVKLIVKNNNIFIECNKKAELINSESQIEIIDDHYKKLNKDVYLKYQFDYEKKFGKLNPKYTSIYNPFRYIIEGFKKLKKYSIFRKILLAGYLIAAMLMLFSVSEYFKYITIDENNFMNVDRNYYVYNQKMTYDEFNKVDASFVIPINTLSGEMLYKQFYQTESDFVQSFNIDSVVDVKVLQQSNIICGTFPKDGEVIIDKYFLENYIKDYQTNQVGINNVEEFIGKEIRINSENKFNEKTYKIVGISEMNSPSLYFNTEDLYKILSLSSEITLNEESKKLNDYEILAPLGTEIKLNGKTLEVVGEADKIYANERTLEEYLVSNADRYYAYSNKEVKNFKSTYNQSKEKYVNEKKKETKLTFAIMSFFFCLSLFETFMISRSSFLSRIKEVGIYRIIGFKKKEIYKMFMGEIIAINVVAVLPGILLMYYILNSISSSATSFGIIINPFIGILTFIIFSLVNIIFGLVPVFATLRSTPSAIMARNDAQ